MTLAALALTVSACNPLASEEADTQSVAIDDPEPPDATPADPTADSTERPTFDRDADVPDPIALDLEVRHPSGTVVRLNGVVFTQSSIEIDATIINGYDRAQELAGILSGVVLHDDVGNEYSFLPPEDNPRLRVSSGERLDGTLAFTGRLAPTATTMTLTFNPRGSEGARIADYPRIGVEGIPVSR